MDQSRPMEPYNRNGAVVADYREQSREFLAKSREYLADGEWHQAAEKGWGAAAWMAKAVAQARGWDYSRHDEFFTVMYQAQDLPGDPRIRHLGSIANTMHGYFYTRKRFLYPEVIGANINDIETLLDILQPLTEGE